MDVKTTRLLRDRLRILERESVRPFDNEADCCGLTLSQCHTVVEVGNRREVSLVDLAEAFGLDTSTLSRTIQGLVEIGLVDRRSSARDRRFVTITLTAQGRRVYRNIETRFNGYIGSVLDRIPANRRSEIVEAVSLLAETILKHNVETGCCRERKSHVRR
jgi:DNA-binding MarR family transcriptional regulator